MDSKTANMMQFSDNSKHMPHERLQFGNFHGRDALEITLKQSDIGSIGDAGRDMGWGNAQRIQIREKEYKRECGTEKNTGISYQCSCLRI